MVGQYVLTLDVDWAPDGVIDEVAALLVAHQVKATWLITHASAAVDRLRTYPDLFELGIHPNFLPGSTQGTTPEYVLRSCLEIVPDAVSMRTHSLVQSSPLLDLVMRETPIRVDASLVLPYARTLSPVTFRYGGRELTRLPTIWTDDLEMEQEQPCWNRCFSQSGLTVLCFHPIHIAMNNRSMDTYRRCRESLVVSPGEGTRSFFLRVLEQMSEARWMRDYASL